MFLFFPFISLLIIFDTGLPLFYKQDRLGKNGEIIRITKFRTMVDDEDNVNNIETTKEDDQRVTRIGNFLRKTHLDELPQFISVLRNDLSLVGPRAEWVKLVPRYEGKVPFYRARLLVKPGITGWAQINYGYASTVEETIIKLEYDLYYVQHRSLLMDLSIHLRTFSYVFQLKGR